MDSLTQHQIDIMKEKEKQAALYADTIHMLDVIAEALIDDWKVTYSLNL